MKNKLSSQFEKAQKLHSEGKLPDAIQCYEAILKEAPHNSLALKNLGLAYAQSGEMRQAIHYLNKAIEQNPEDASQHNNLANAYRKVHETEKAIDHYQKALQIVPDYAQAHNNLAAVYALKGNYLKALDHYKQAVHSEPDFVEAHFNLGLLLLKNNQLEAAEKQFQNVLALNPHHGHAQSLLAVIFLSRDELDKAKKGFKKIIEQHPEDLEALTNLGVIALKQEKAQQAIDYFTRALSIDNQYIEARNNLASTFMHHDRFENALMHYDELLKQDPHNIEYHYNSGVAQMALGHLNEAIHHFEQVLQVDEEHFAALNNLAAIYSRLNQKDKARELLQRAVKANPNDSSSRHMLNALTGKDDRHSTDYANHLFDNYALYYDQHMQGQLHYVLPQEIGKLLHHLHAFSFKHGLDLGCGTGLSGIVLREITEQLTGVDISKKMLAQAREKQLYDQLVNEEAIEFLSHCKESFDLIVAADVLPYFSELDTLFSAIQARLSPKGLFIFSTEISPDKPWHLQSTARYSHQPEYIQSLCKAYQFELLEHKKITARFQEKTELPVMLYACLK